MNTAKSLLLSLLFLIPSWMISQEIVDANKLWSIANIHCQPWGNAYSTFFYKFEGDTVVQDTAYQKVMISTDELHENWDFFGAFIREENGQVFYRELYQEEGLIYDFSLQIGDTVLVNNTRALEAIHLVLNQVDSVPAQSGYVERWQLSCVEYPDQTETWIRGIGSMAGVMNSSVDIFGGLCGLYVLLCSSDFGNTVYQNPEFESCWLVITDIGDREVATTTPKIYISEINRQIVVETWLPEESTITFIHLNGQIIDQFTTHNQRFTLPISDRYRGFMLVSVTQGKEVTTQKLFVR